MVKIVREDLRTTSEATAVAFSCPAFRNLTTCASTNAHLCASLCASLCLADVAVR